MHARGDVAITHARGNGLTAVAYTCLATRTLYEVCTDFLRPVVKPFAFFGASDFEVPTAGENLSEYYLASPHVRTSPKGKIVTYLVLM